MARGGVFLPEETCSGGKKKKDDVVQSATKRGGVRAKYAITHALKPKEKRQGDLWSPRDHIKGRRNGGQNAST